MRTFLARALVWGLVLSPLLVLGCIACAVLAAAEAAHAPPLRAVALTALAAALCWLAVDSLRFVRSLASGARLQVSFSLAAQVARKRLEREPTTAEILREFADGMERATREEVRP